MTMLAIVQDQQDVLALERGRELAGLAGAKLHVQDIGDQHRHELGIVERRQLDQRDPVGVMVEQAAADLDRQPRLADTAGAGQRHQPMLPQTRRDLVEIGFATDQGVSCGGRLFHAEAAAAGAADAGAADAADGGALSRSTGATNR